MTISLELITGLVASIVSLVALIYSLKKQSHDEANLDADTISKLYQTLKQQDERYHTLENEYHKMQKEWEQYRQLTNRQLAELASENHKLRTWAKRLCEQLEAAGMIPHEFKG